MLSFVAVYNEILTNNDWVDSKDIILVNLFGSVWITIMAWKNSLNVFKI